MSGKNIDITSVKPPIKKSLGIARTDIINYDNSFRLGKHEKELLLALKAYQYCNSNESSLDYFERFPNISRDTIDRLHGGYYKIRAYQRHLDAMREKMDSKHRITFSKTINRLHEKGLICMLENSEENHSKFTKASSLPYLYGRGKYQKLIGLTVEGLKIAKEIKSENKRKSLNARRLKQKSKVG